jgi:hypothetical protein
MAFGAPVLEKQEDRGRLFSVPYDSTPAVQVFEFAQPVKSVGREDGHVLLSWRGSLTPKVVREWLGALNQILPYDGKCEMDVWSSRSIPPKIYDTPNYERSESTLRRVEDAEAAVSLRPLTLRYNLFVEGDLRQENAAMDSQKADCRVGVNIAVRDLESLNTRALIAKLLVDTSDVPIAHDATGPLFKSVREALKLHS